MRFVHLGRRHTRTFAYAIGFLAPVAHVTIAFAQSTGGAGPGGTGGSGGSTGGTGSGAGTTGGAAAGGTQSSTTYTYFPGGVAPTPAGQPLGGGNVQYSSSKPITGNERDGFDFKNGGSTGTLRGNENSSFVIGGTTERTNANANLHVVRKGDTLWAICDSYFQNPYQWPRIWSYNPQIQNPHWIYPGDQVRLKSGVSELALPGAPATELATSGGIVDRRRQVPPDTVFLRSEGYIEDENNNWGEVTGSREDKMFLGDFDEIYLRVASNHDLKVGQELTIYRPIRDVGKGKLIAIQGTAKVDVWNPKERIARARITESLDVIERGARVGPVARRFEVVPPSRDEVDVEASVIASVVPYDLYGQNQVIFLDKGEEAGLKPGNRLVVAKKGDAWHQSLTTRSSARRIALEDPSPAATESVPKPSNEQKLPEEILAELRVISVRKKTSMAIVTMSRREIEAGDKAVARKGY